MNKRGFSIIEILVVISIFAVVAYVASQSVIFSLKGARKSDTSSRVRDNLSFAMSIVERQLRNAKSIDAITCAGNQINQISYKDHNDVATSFTCMNQFGPAVDGYIASGAARLTNDDVSLVFCRFTCTPSIDPALPPSVKVIFTGQDKNASGAEKSPITLDTEILLRAY